MTEIVRINAVRIERMRQALATKPQTYDQLAAISGLAKPAVARWVKTMRGEGMQKIYIADWADDERGRKFVPMFKWGKGKDKPRPGRAHTAAERMRNLRARRRQAKEAAKC